VLSLASLRLRWRSFAGMFVALVLGSALVAALGLVLATTAAGPDRAPQRYAATPVVVTAVRTFGVPTRRGTTMVPLTEPRGVPAALAARLPGAVLDRVFPAALVDGPGGAVGRPWSATRAAGQALTAGRRPSAPGEIAVSAGAVPGDRVGVVTAAGVRPYTVVGVTAPGPQPTIFFTDAEAALLSPRIDALALWRSPDRVRAVVGDSALVLTGSQRARLDPGRDRDDRARADANTITGIALGFAVFVSAFVVAATFAFAVGRRRRELALLRAVGATPGQVRRMVYAEALLVATAGSAAGALAGPYAAPALLTALRERGMAPDWIRTVADAAWPAWSAFAAGLLVALVAMVAAAARAGRVRPVEAMREAVVPARALPPSRLVVGAATLLTAVTLMAVTAIGDPASATNRKTYLPVLMLLIAAGGLLAPAVVAPVARLLVRPLRRLGGAGSVLVSAAAETSAARIAAVAVPVLLTLGLPAALLSASAMTDAATGRIADRAVDADYLVRPDGTAGLDAEAVARLRAVAGARVVTSAPTQVYQLDREGALIRRRAEATDAVPDGSIVVTADWAATVGDDVEVWLGDGGRARLRVIEVRPDGSPADAYLARRYAFAALPTLARVTGGDPAELTRAVAGHRAAVTTRAEAAAGGGAGRLGTFLVLGILLTYTAIALVNTLLMGAPDRAGQRRTLALIGATRAQVLGWTVAESLVAVAVGTVLAGAVAAGALAGLWAALARLAGPVPVDVPWLVLAAALAGCAVLTAAAAALPARRG
jgi:putative ABC transport system permease protein